MSAIDVTLRIGGVFATDREAVIRTVLGSCISACVYDPISRVGGMNHFMLPSYDREGPKSDLTRYGVHAMEVLIGSIQRLGGRRDRLLVKLFGGGHVLATAESEHSVPARNIEFIQSFVREEGLQVLSQDLGGYLPRRVHFYPHDGRALIKRMGAGAIRELELEERQVELRPPTRPADDITLFDE